MTKYIIEHKDGGYLRQDETKRFTRTTYWHLAQRFTYEKAQNVLKNAFNSKELENWNIIAAETDEETSAASDCTMQFDWNVISSQQQMLFQNLRAYEEQLRSQLSEVDMEICDIQHYIEFFQLDAAKGYKAYRMLKERLARRRHIKDEMAKTRCFIEGTPQTFSNGHVSRQLGGFDSRQYHPRVLGELFDVHSA